MDTDLALSSLCSFFLALTMITHLVTHKLKALKLHKVMHHQDITA